MEECLPGRTQMEKAHIKFFLDIIQTKPGWNEKLNKWKTDYLLIINGTFLDLLLQKEAKDTVGKKNIVTILP